MIFLNKSKRRFLVCACISVLASAKTYGMESSKPVDSDMSESKSFEENLSSLKADTKKENATNKKIIEKEEIIDLFKKEKDDDEEKYMDTSRKYDSGELKITISEEFTEKDKLSELQNDLNWYNSYSHQFNVVAHKVIAQEGGYKDMGKCLFGYDNDNKDEIKNYIEEDELYRHIMFEIDSIRAQYKDKDYEKGGGWAAIGANPSFYSEDNKKIDISKYHEGEERTPIDDEKDFTNTFRTIGLYIRNYVYYLSYMKLFKNGKDLEEKDADILKHYVQRIIDDDDTYKTAYTKKYLFDKIGEILSDDIFSKDNSILNPEDVKKLEELADGIKNNHEHLEEGTSALISGDYEDKDELNSINENIENDIDTSYFKIIDFAKLQENVVCLRNFNEAIDYNLSRHGVWSSTLNLEPINRVALDEPKIKLMTVLENCMTHIVECMKKNNLVSGNFIPAILESIDKKDNKEMEKLIYKVSTIQNEINAFTSLYNFDRNYIVDPENVIAVTGTANTFGRTNVPILDIVPAKKLSIPTLVKDITLNTRNLRDLLKLEFNDDDIINVILNAVVKSKGILTKFMTATQNDPKFVCYVPNPPDETEATEEVLKNNPFANTLPTNQSLIIEIMEKVKEMSSISGCQYLTLKKIFQRLNYDLKIVIWDGENETPVFDKINENNLLLEPILDNIDIRSTKNNHFVVYPTENSIKTISRLKELKQLGQTIGTKLLLEVVENLPKLGKIDSENPEAMDSDLLASISLMINLQDIPEKFLPYKNYEKHFYNPYNEFFIGEDASLDMLYQHNDGILTRVEHGYIYDSDSRKFIEIEAELNSESLKQCIKQLFREKTLIKQENEGLIKQVKSLKDEISALKEKINSLEPEVEAVEDKDSELEKE